MKTKLLLSLLLAIYGMVNAQDSIILPIDSLTGKVIYTEIVKIDSLTKDELYLKGREWVANVFKSSMNVIQMDDKEGGKIICKGQIEIIGEGTWGMIGRLGYLVFTITLNFKNERYRYEITNLSHQGWGSLPNKGNIEREEMSDKYSKKVWSSFKIESDKQIKLLIKDLKDFMTKSNDW